MRLNKKTHNPNNFSKTSHKRNESHEKAKTQRCLAKPPWS